MYTKKSSTATKRFAKCTKFIMLCSAKKDDVVCPGKKSPSESINSISWRTLEGLEYFDASKRIIRYKFYPGDLASETTTKNLLWGVVSRRCVVKTMLNSEETSNVANPGDFIMCGPDGEKYVVRFDKMPELYERELDDPMIMMVRKGAPRKVAQYNGKEGSFEPSWGGNMVLKCGDFVVREAKNKYYRIEKNMFKDTYEKMNP